MAEYKFKQKDLVIINKKDLKTYYEWKLGKCFIFTDEAMESLKIEKMVPTDKEENKNKKEIWAFAKFDRNDMHKAFAKERKYIISTFGRVYDIQDKKMLKQSDSSGYFMTASGEKYKRVNVKIYDERTVYYVHRLVASTYIRKPDETYDIVDHIDEHPYNNYVWNLAWTDKSGNANKHNAWIRSGESSTIPTKTTWTVGDIKEICYMIADGHKATYIFNTLLEKYPKNPMIQYEKIRTLYKHIMRRGDFHEIALSCGVHFNESGKADYSKEKTSVANAEKRKEETKQEENKKD